LVVECSAKYPRIDVCFSPSCRPYFPRVMPSALTWNLRLSRERAKVLPGCGSRGGTQGRHLCGIVFRFTYAVRGELKLTALENCDHTAAAGLQRRVGWRRSLRNASSIAFFYSPTCGSTWSVAHALAAVLVVRIRRAVTSYPLTGGMPGRQKKGGGCCAS
jgi:hypothetical protein